MYEWLPAAGGGGGGGAQQPEAVDPAVVAHRAVEEMELPDPVIRTSPDEAFTQVVRVPTWMWLDKSVWEPVSETASAPGVKVTATATPQKVTWTMGDGNRVVCEGPGTPYSKKYEPSAKSPDCGHVYRRTSIGQPEEAFEISATITWAVQWQGAGEAGTVPGVETTAEVPVRVSEAQAVVVR